MANLNRVAVRTFHRLWQPISDRFETAAIADAGFDGGEYSGPLLAEREEQARQDLLERIAPRFGMTAWQLDMSINMQEYDALQKWIEAGQP